MVKKLRRNKHKTEKTNNTSKSIFSKIAAAITIVLPKQIKKLNFRAGFTAFMFAVVGVALLLNTQAAPMPVSNSNLPVVQKLSIYPGYGDARGQIRHESIENQLGRKIGYANGFASMSTWGGVANDTYGQFVQSDALFVKRRDVVAVFAFPLRTSPPPRFEVNLPGGPERIRQGLFDTANGVNDASIREIGQRLVAAGQNNAILRVGGEMEIDFNPYTMRAGNEDAYIAAFRRAVDVIRSVPGSNFKIDFNGNGDFHRSYTSPRTGITQTYGQAAYPGDQWVDFIGVDVYDRQSWAGSLEKLNHALNLAKQHNKPFSVAEWGLWKIEGQHGGDDPSFIQNMYDYLNSLPASGAGSLAYHSYFYDYVDSNLDKYPNAKAKFIQLFSQKGGTVTPPNLPNINIVPGSLVTIPAAPKAGDEVKFQVTIKNDGTGPTPAGIKHGVSFWVNNANVAWSDDSLDSLAPGATRVLTTNGGPDGNATWTATQGSIPVTAKWDDIIPPRFTESDSIKDTEVRTITVTAGTTIDPEPPTATITTTPSGAVDANTYTLDVNATDNVAIARVAIEVVNGPGFVGAELVSDNTAPYSLAVNTRALTNGNYQLQAVSYDTSGNKTASSPVTLKVRLVDIDRSGTVEIGDLTALISSWNQNNPAKATNPAHDLDDDGVIGVGDLTKLISRWGR